MAYVSAEQLLQHDSPEAVATIDGLGDLRCKKLDLPTLAFNGILPLPLMEQAFAIVFGMAGQSADAVGRMATEHPEFAQFIDKWVCLAAVEPRVVADDPAPVGCVPVGRLLLTTKLAIFAATVDIDQVAVEAAKSFRRQSAGGTGYQRRHPRHGQ